MFSDTVELRTQGAQVRTTLANVRPQANEQTRDFRVRIGMLDAQLDKIDSELALQRKQAFNTTRFVDTIRPTLAKGVISVAQFTQYQSAALADQLQVKALERQRLDIAQQRSTLQTQLAQVPFDTAAKANQLRGQLDQLDAQLAENAAQIGTVLRAPRAGIVSTLLTKAGQNVAAGQPVLSILPKGSKLEAQLLVPSSAIGFVVAGTPVVLRYDAFPYQRFGQQYGRVVQVSRSALTSAEADALLGQGQKITASTYRVLVALDRQTIDAHDKPIPLKPGMALSADILLGRTSLWAWAFDPLGALGQQLTYSEHKDR